MESLRAIARKGQIVRRKVLTRRHEDTEEEKSFDTNSAVDDVLVAVVYNLCDFVTLYGTMVLKTKIRTRRHEGLYCELQEKS